MDNYKNGATSEDRVFPTEKAEANAKMSLTITGNLVIAKNCRIFPAGGYEGRIKAGVQGILSIRYAPAFVYDPASPASESSQKFTAELLGDLGELGEDYDWRYIKGTQVVLRSGSSLNVLEEHENKITVDRVPNVDGAYPKAKIGGVATKFDRIETFYLDSRTPGGPEEFEIEFDSTDGHVAYVRSVPANADGEHIPKALEQRKNKGLHKLHFGVAIPKGTQEAIIDKHRAIAGLQVITFKDPVMKDEQGAAIIHTDKKIKDFCTRMSAGASYGVGWPKKSIVDAVASASQKETVCTKAKSKSKSKSSKGKGKEPQPVAGYIARQAALAHGDPTVSVEKRNYQYAMMYYQANASKIDKLYDKADKAALEEIAEVTPETAKAWDKRDIFRLGQELSSDCPRCGEIRPGSGSKNFVTCGACKLKQSIYEPVYKLYYHWTDTTYGKDGKWKKDGTIRDRPLYNYEKGHQVFVRISQDIPARDLKRAYMDEFRVPSNKGGRVQCMLSGTALVEGIDVPDVDIGLCISPTSTENPVPNLQALGRVLRVKKRTITLPDGSKKTEVMPKDFIILYQAETVTSKGTKIKTKESQVVDLFQSELQYPSDDGEGSRWVCEGGFPHFVSQGMFFAQFKKYYTGKEKPAGGVGGSLFTVPQEMPFPDYKNLDSEQSVIMSAWIQQHIVEASGKVDVGFDHPGLSEIKIKQSYKIIFWPDREADENKFLKWNHVRGSLTLDGDRALGHPNPDLPLFPGTVSSATRPGVDTEAVIKLLMDYNNSPNASWEVEADYDTDKQSLADLVSEQTWELTPASLTAISPQMVEEIQAAMSSAQLAESILLNEIQNGEHAIPYPVCPVCNVHIEYFEVVGKGHNQETIPFSAQEKMDAWHGHLLGDCDNSPTPILQKLKKDAGRALDKKTSAVRCWEQHNQTVVKRISQEPIIDKTVQLKFKCELDEFRKSGNLQGLMDKYAEIVEGLPSATRVWVPVWYKPIGAAFCKLSSPRLKAGVEMPAPGQPEDAWVKPGSAGCKATKEDAKQKLTDWAMTNLVKTKTAVADYYGEDNIDPIAIIRENSYILNADNGEIWSYDLELMVPTAKALVGKFVVRCGPRIQVTDDAEQAKKIAAQWNSDLAKAEKNRSSYVSGMMYGKKVKLNESLDCVCKILTYSELPNGTVIAKHVEVTAKKKKKKTKVKTEKIDGIRLSKKTYTLWLNSTMTHPAPRLKDYDDLDGEIKVNALQQGHDDLGMIHKHHLKQLKAGITTHIAGSATKESNYKYTLWLDSDFTMMYTVAKTSGLRHVGAKSITGAVTTARKIWKEKGLTIYIKGLPGDWVFYQDSDYNHPWTFGEEDEEGSIACAKSITHDAPNKQYQRRQAILAIITSGQWDGSNLHVFINSGDTHWKSLTSAKLVETFEKWKDCLEDEDEGIPPKHVWKKQTWEGSTYYVCDRCADYYTKSEWPAQMKEWESWLESPAERKAFRKKWDKAKKLRRRRYR
jgi:hypothetical protein